MTLKEKVKNIVREELIELGDIEPEIPGSMLVLKPGAFAAVVNRIAHRIASEVVDHLEASGG